MFKFKTVALVALLAVSVTASAKSPKSSGAPSLSPTGSKGTVNPTANPTIATKSAKAFKSAKMGKS